LAQFSVNMSLFTGIVHLTAVIMCSKC